MVTVENEFYQLAGQRVTSPELKGPEHVGADTWFLLYLQINEVFLNQHLTQ